MSGKSHQQYLVQPFAIVLLQKFPPRTRSTKGAQVYLTMFIGFSLFKWSLPFYRYDFFWDVPNHHDRHDRLVEEWIPIMGPWPLLKDWVGFEVGMKVALSLAWCEVCIKTRIVWRVSWFLSNCILLWLSLCFSGVFVSSRSTQQPYVYWLYCGVMWICL